MSAPPPSSHRVVTGPDGAPRLVKRAVDPQGRARLSGEARLLTALDHPQVVHLLDVVDDAGGTELHLAWVGPHTLATVTGLDVHAAGTVVGQVASVVADLHRAGLSHRRLTPDHILLAAGGRPVLTGLADARATTEATTEAAPADDVAALGALLVGLLRPLDDALVVPDRRRHRPRDGGLRGALLTLADQAQADDPSSRPDADGFAEALRATLTPPRARPGRAGARRREEHSASTPPPAGRRRTLARLGAGAGLAVAVASTVAATTWIRSGEASSATASPSTPVPTTTGPAVDPSPSRQRPRADSGVAPPPATGPDHPASSTVPPTSTPGPASTGPRPDPPSCPSATGSLVADVDGDGCPEAVTIAGERVTVGATTWIAGRPGDVAVVADWDCDGVATVASLRPSTGEVFVFDGWAAVGSEVTVAPVATIGGATSLDPLDDGDGCPALVVHRGPAPPATVEVPS